MQRWNELRTWWNGLKRWQKTFIVWLAAAIIYMWFFGWWHFRPEGYWV
jgi:hypothetical protein